MMMLIRSWLAAVLLTMPWPALAQTRQDEQAWVNVTVQGSVKGRLVFFAEVQPRIGEGLRRLDQLLLRPAIGWRVSPRLTLYQGYAHVFVPIAGGRDANEERSFQQATWLVATGRGGELTSRSRLEQRWRSNGNDMGWRARQMLRYELPLQKKPRAIGALGTVEGYVALDDTDWGARRGFDQVRTFIGVEVPLPGTSTVEVGYLNQIIDQPAGRTRMNHVASVNVFVRL